MELRLGCPSATCSLAAGDTEKKGGHGLVLQIRCASADAQFHGAYALQITWNDGHRTGLYTFEALRRWSVFGPPR